MNIQKADYKWVKVDPDPNFDPERNKRIIAEVIEENEKLARKKRREFQEGMGERAQAIAKFLKSNEKGRAKTDMVKYFGTRELARLRGEEVLNKLRFEITGKTKDGKIIRKPI